MHTQSPNKWCLHFAAVPDIFQPSLCRTCLRWLTKNQFFHFSDGQWQHRGCCSTQMSSLQRFRMSRHNGHNATLCSDFRERVQTFALFKFYKSGQLVSFYQPSGVKVSDVFCFVFFIRLGLQLLSIFVMEYWKEYLNDSSSKQIKHPICSKRWLQQKCPTRNAIIFVSTQC